MQTHTRLSVDIATTAVRQLSQRDVSAQTPVAACFQFPSSTGTTLDRSGSKTGVSTVNVTLKALSKAVTITTNSIAVSPLDPIDMIRPIVANASGIPVHAQRLVLAGKVLADARCLMDYGILSKDVVVHVAVKPGVDVASLQDGAGDSSAAASTGPTNTTTTNTANAGDAMDVTEPKDASGVGVVQRIRNDSEFWTRMSAFVCDWFKCTPNDAEKVCQVFKQALEGANKM